MPRTRPDRCPGVLSVHPAADGGLARIRLPGGTLSAAQLAALTAAAVELGDGGLELTSRANVQLRALRPGAALELSDRLYDAGLLPSLSHERVRNIVASPRTGLDTLTVYDVGPLVAEVDRRLQHSPALAELPGRFLFGLDDGHGDITSLAPDVTAQAVTATHAALLLSGHDTGIRVPWPEIPALLIATAEAFLAELRAQNSAGWRIADLTDGPTAVLTRLDLPSGVGKLGISPHLVTPACDDLSRTRVGPWRRPDGLAAAELGVRLGRLGPEHAEALDVDLRVTPWRSLVVPQLAGDPDESMSRYASAGLVVDPGSAWVGMTACAGRPGCASALADVRADAVRVVPALAAGGPVHWSGCERRCGRPKGAVDVVATGDGYTVNGAAAGSDPSDAIAECRSSVRNDAAGERTGAGPRPAASFLTDERLGGA